MLDEVLGYKFKDREVLKTALTHSSYANEASVESNERLEFLGDSVLGFIVARILFECYPQEPEGVLSKMRGAIVSSSNFAKLAREHELDKEILLGIGEEKSGGRRRDSIIAGAFEAIIGGIYLDGGYDSAKSVVVRITEGCLEKAELFEDYKTKLQELVQKERKCVPRYYVVKEEGPPHKKNFYVDVRVDNSSLGRGVGRNKKEAEQAAAKEALEKSAQLMQKLCS